jgi:hypothetical protein
LAAELRAAAVKVQEANKRQEEQSTRAHDLQLKLKAQKEV